MTEMIDKVQPHHRPNRPKGKYIFPFSIAEIVKNMAEKSCPYKRNSAEALFLLFYVITAEKGFKHRIAQCRAASQKETALFLGDEFFLGQRLQHRTIPVLQRRAVALCKIRQRNPRRIRRCRKQYSSISSASLSASRSIGASWPKSSSCI